MIRCRTLSIEHPVCLTEAVKTAGGMTVNCEQFNITGHPALSINAGFTTAAADDADVALPVGLMIVGKRFDDETVLAYAKCFETQRDSEKTA